MHHLTSIFFHLFIFFILNYRYVLGENKCLLHFIYSCFHHKTRIFTNVSQSIHLSEFIFNIQFAEIKIDCNLHINIIYLFYKYFVTFMRKLNHIMYVYLLVLARTYKNKSSGKGNTSYIDDFFFALRSHVHIFINHCNNLVCY